MYFINCTFCTLSRKLIFFSYTLNHHASAKVYDHNTFQFKNYLYLQLPIVPPTITWLMNNAYLDEFN